MKLYFSKLSKAIEVAKKCELLCSADSQWSSDQWFLGSTYPIAEIGGTNRKRKFIYEK